MAVRKGNKTEREHDKIVKELKEMLESKGIECLPFRRDRVEVMRKGFTINSKTNVTAFIPDIIIEAGETDEDVILVEYVNSKRQLRHDARGMMLLSLMGYCRAQGFNLVLNDSILDYDRGIPEEANIQQMSLSTFKKFLQKNSKENFLGFLRG